MKRILARVTELSFMPLIILIFTLFLLKEIGILSMFTGYELCVYVIPLLAIPSLLRAQSAGEQKLPAVFYLMLVTFILALGIRLFPLTRSSIPLGYDAGFYKYTMELYHNALPQIPEQELATWVKEMYPQGLFVLSDVMYVTAGTAAIDNINYIFPLLGAFIVFPLFVVTRTLFGSRVGAIASILYVISYTQYTAFTMLYFKNILGLTFLLLAMYALEKKKDGLLALMFAAMGIFHRPEFLLFALILIAYFILHRRRGIVLAAIGTSVLIAQFWIPRWEIYWGVISSTIEGGTFFGFDTYTLVSLAYLPFAAIGAVYLLVNRGLNSVLFYFGITCIIVIFQLFFFNRFIIMLDMAIIILAALGIDCTLLQKTGWHRMAGIAAIMLILVLSALPTVTEINTVRPRITEEQLGAVEWIKDNAEDNAYVLATSSDAPWVLGWSERRVIAPGLFEWYLHSKEEWFNFIESKDPEIAKGFLAAYESPVYIYYSKKSGNYLALEKFESVYFENVYDGGAVVYRYLGGD